MNKVVKFIYILFIALVLIVAVTKITYAADGVISDLDGKINIKDVDGDEASEFGGKIVNFLQFTTILGGTSTIALLGLKYMLGSVEEKAEYKKSFMPLVVGIVIAMSATTIVRLILSTFEN